MTWLIVNEFKWINVKCRAVAEWIFYVINQVNQYPIHHCSVAKWINIQIFKWGGRRPNDVQGVQLMIWWNCVNRLLNYANMQMRLWRVLVSYRSVRRWRPIRRASGWASATASSSWRMRRRPRRRMLPADPARAMWSEPVIRQLPISLPNCSFQILCTALGKWRLNLRTVNSIKSSN